MTTRDGRPYALQTKTGKKIEHATYSVYSTHSCRCEQCTDLWMAYQNNISLDEWRTRKTERKMAQRRLSKETRSISGHRVVNYSTKTGKLLKHGTASTYQYHGCRCTDCRNFMLEKTKRWQSKNREKVSASHYKYRENNREKLRNASRKYWEENPEKELERMRKYREGNPNSTAIKENKRTARRQAQNEFSRKKAIRDGLPYTEQEDALLLSQTPALSLALGMGRSLNSIRGRRYRLRKKLREQGIDPDTMQPLDNN